MTTFLQDILLLANVRKCSITQFLNQETCIFYKFSYKNKIRKASESILSGFANNFFLYYFFNISFTRIFVKQIQVSFNLFFYLYVFSSNYLFLFNYILFSPLCCWLLCHLIHLLTVLHFARGIIGIQHFIKIDC